MSSKSIELKTPNATHCLTFDNVSFEVNVGRLGTFLHGGTVGARRILNDVSGTIRSGQVMAIIGPSGAGKTTLLDTLAAQPHVMRNSSITLSGKIAVDGEPISRNYFSKHCAYLPQHDALWTALTTLEHLTYSARLYGVPSDQLVANTQAVLKDLGLTACADVMVGSVFIRGLSGGQKRRLSLACELIAGEKSNYFLDEPTSGLDAAAASEIMRVITQVARTRNVVMVASVHQPSSRVFYEFDLLLLLSRGRTAFCGQATDALPYFESDCGLKPDVAMNPADYIVEIVNADFNDPVKVDAILDRWTASTQATPEISARSKDSGVGFSPVRVLTLLMRMSTLYVRDPAVYTFRFMLYAFMSGFLGVTYYRITYDQKDVLDRMFCIIWIVAFFSYMSMVALPSFALEKQVVVKEITNGAYSLSEYCLANAFIQIPILVLCAIISATLAFWIPELNPEFDRFVAFVGILATHLYVVESFGILVAAVIPNFVLGLIFFNAGISQFFVFNGFFVSVGNIPKFLIWLYYISPFSYTNQALFKIVFGDLQMDGYEKCKQLDDYACYGETGNDVLESISDSDLDYNDTEPWAWFGVLVGMAVALRFGFYILLRRYVS